MRYDPKIYRELQRIRDRIPRNTYKTILGQLRAGDMIGAAMGVKRLQRQIAKADKEGGESMKYKVCPNCGARHDIFASGGGGKLAAKYHIPLLAQLPLDPKFMRDCDAGVLPDTLEEYPEISRSMRDVARGMSRE